MAISYEDRGSFRGWWVWLALVGVAALVLTTASVRESTLAKLLSQHSQPAVHSPRGQVLISEHGKTFHVAGGCPYLHGKSQLVPAEVAVRKGYNPCVRCEHELLMRSGTANEDVAPR